MLRRVLTVAVVGVLLSGGCSTGSDSAVDDTTSAEVTHSTMSATTSSTAVVPTTPDSPTSTTTTAPGLAFPMEGEPWDLLVVTNSFGLGVAEAYAAHASDALGVTVNADEAAIDRLTASKALLHLHDAAYPPLADLVRNAEIIVAYGVPERSGEWFETCFIFQTNPRILEREYTDDDWEQYRDELDELFAEIWRLREGLPTVLRTHDIPIGIISEWRDLGKESGCIASWESNSEAIRASAETYGVTLVSLFDVFNGPNHDQDPREKGWIHEDGIHTNEAGALAIADALAATGFEPTTQP